MELVEARQNVNPPPLAVSCREVSRRGMLRGGGGDTFDRLSAGPDRRRFAALVRLDVARALVRVGGGIVALVAGVGVVMLYLFDPAAVGFFPPCPFHGLTGLHCPGCGTLRATHALLNGEVMRALLLNPVYLVLLGAIVVGGAWRVVEMLRGRAWTPLSARLRPGWIWGLAVVICVYWVIRNLPWPPFALLAP